MTGKHAGEYRPAYDRLKSAYRPSHRADVPLPVIRINRRVIEARAARTQADAVSRNTGARRPSTSGLGTPGTNPALRSESVPTGTYGSTARRKSVAKMTGAMKSPDGNQSLWALPGVYKSAITVDSRWSDTINNTWQRAA